MSIDTIAGLGGITFTVLIGVAIVVSLDDRIFQAMLGKWVTFLMLTGIAGFCACLIIATCCWTELNTRGKISVISIDFIGALAIFALSGYYLFFYRRKVWGISHIYPSLPPEQPLIPR